MVSQTGMCLRVNGMSASAWWVRSGGICGTPAGWGQGTDLHLVVAEGAADGVLDVADLHGGKDTGRRAGGIRGAVWHARDDSHLR